MAWLIVLRTARALPLAGHAEPGEFTVGFGVSLDELNERGGNVHCHTSTSSGAGTSFNQSPDNLRSVGAIPVSETAA